MNKKFDTEIGVSAGILPAKRNHVENSKRQWSEESSEDNSDVSQSKKERLITPFFVSLQTKTSNYPFWCRYNPKHQAYQQLPTKRG